MILHVPLSKLVRGDTLHQYSIFVASLIIMSWTSWNREKIATISSNNDVATTLAKVKNR